VVADRPSAQAASGEEFRLSVVIEGRHLVTILTAASSRRRAMAPVRSGHRVYPMDRTTVRLTQA
jgi:hypothetical protein